MPFFLFHNQPRFPNFVSARKERKKKKSRNSCLGPLGWPMRITAKMGCAQWYLGEAWVYFPCKTPQALTMHSFSNKTFHNSKLFRARTRKRNLFRFEFYLKSSMRVLNYGFISSLVAVRLTIILLSVISQVRKKD